MRKASIVLAFTACAASSLALAQQQDLPTDVGSRSTSTASTSTASTPTMTDTTADDGSERGKSGFGQIMSVLTGLLQDAAARESVRASATASETLSSEESAVTITVTPVAGRSTFFVDKPQRDQPRPNADTTSSSTRIAASTIDADAAPAQIAMQPQGERPD